MLEYRRNLPHILPEEGVFFVTFRINNSLPLHILTKFKSEYQKEIKEAKKTIKNSTILKSRITEIFDEYFFDFDALLDKYVSKYNLTENKAIAQIMTNAIEFLNKKDYQIIAYCIMPNHVHLIIFKLKKPLFQIMKVLKGFSASEINKVLNRKGTFWHSESYDNVIRSRNELHNKIMYTLNNPVRAGLVNHYKDWPYSYCNSKFLEE
jgi:REP element-mobilizing transposase RayT